MRDQSRPSASTSATSRLSSSPVHAILIAPRQRQRQGGSGADGAGAEPEKRAGPDFGYIASTRATVHRIGMCAASRSDDAPRSWCT